MNVLRIKSLRSTILNFLMLASSALQGIGPVASAADVSGDYYVFFGTYTVEKSKGIYVARFDSTTGKLSTPELAVETKNPTFLALAPSSQALYAVNEVDDFGTGGSGGVSAFKVDSKTGRLSFLNEQPSGGSGPCHLAVDQAGQCVLVANYGSGSVAVLPVGADGGLQKPSVSIQHHGSSINRQRQEGPHAHFITWDPDNRLVLTCDLGLDKILIYKLVRPQFSLEPNDPPSFMVKPGSGPRHVAFHPNRKVAFIINEMASSVVVCSYDARRGEFKELQTVSTLPEGFDGVNTCAEIVVHPSGRFVYASNRGHNSIGVFSFDAANEKLQLIENQSTEGKTPRHFALDPTSRWLIAENQDSGNIVVFGLDSTTGLLTPTGVTQRLGSPVCAVFLKRQ